MVTSPTRVSNTSRTVIDHIVMNNTDYYREAHALDSGLSDHHMVIISRKWLKLKHQTSYFIGRSYRRFDELAFVQDMANINWTFLYQYNDVNIVSILFTNTILTVIDKHAPYKCIKCCSDQPKWVNPDFLSLIDEKNHLCKVYKRRPSQYNAAWKREAVKRVKQMKRYLKHTHIEESLRDSEGDQKKLWRTINNIWPNKSKTTNINNINGSEDPMEMANSMNDYFSTIGSKLGNNFKPNIDWKMTDDQDPRLPQLNEIKIDDVWDLIHMLSHSKATGLDGIPARVVKLCGEHILSPLHYIFNLSVKTLTFPVIWKQAQILPLFKGAV